MEGFLWLSSALSVVISLVLFPCWIRRCRKQGIVSEDLHKLPRRKLPHHAGLIVMFSAGSAMLFFVAVQTFLEGAQNQTVVFAGLCSLLIALLIGVVDDLLGERIGLRQYQKPLLTIGVALPLVVINAGQNSMVLPFVGEVYLGLVFPLLVVPVGMIGATNGFNMLAGVNGLEASMGVVMLAALGYVSSNAVASLFAWCMVGVLLVFLLLNWFPARILPGNGFTYLVGAAVAVVAIVGNVERAALILFVPYVIEFFLKFRGLMQVPSIVDVMPDGSLENRFVRWYSLNHVVVSLFRRMTGRAFEWQVTSTLVAFELVFVGIVLGLHVL